MLTIRDSQIVILQEVPRRIFEDSMVRHLFAYAPRHCEVIGEPSVRNGVRLGVDRAGRYGLTTRGPVRFYLESMFMFGADFDTDPQVPWAAEILNAPSFSQMSKAERLYARAMEYVERTAGKNYEHAHAVLRRVREEGFEAYPPLDDLFADAMWDLLQRMHPQKVDYLGEDRTRMLIGSGPRLADELSLAPERGAALCVGAMFALGHGFGHDPLLPWIERTIVNPAFSQQVRVERLHARMMIYLDRVIANQAADRSPLP